jgi:WD40 repeat protein
MSNDAFLSYCHAADRVLAAATEKALERLAKPMFAIRAMEVFRDASDLPASSGLGPALEAQLDASRWIVFFASRASAKSAYCSDELAWWIKHRGTAQLLVVLTDGQIVWDREAADFDWQRTDALPHSLQRAFAAEPLYVDLRALREAEDLSLGNPAFRAAMLDLAAPIRGVPKNSLDNDDVRQHRRVRRLARTAVATIALLGVAATFMAIVARQQARLSLARQLSAQALQLVRAQPDLGLLLAVEALNVADTVRGRSALLDALLDRPQLQRVLHGTTQEQLEQQGFRFVGQSKPPQRTPLAPHGKPVFCDGGVETASQSADGRHAAYGCYGGDLRFADARETWTGLSRSGHDQPVTSVVFVERGQIVASGGYDGRILLWHFATGIGMEPAFAENERPILALGLSGDGKTLASLHEGGPAKLWNLNMRARLKQPLGGVDSPDEVLEVLSRDELRFATIEWQPGDALRLAGSIAGTTQPGRLLGFLADDKPAWADDFALAPDADLVGFDRKRGLALVAAHRPGDKGQLLIRGGPSGTNASIDTSGDVHVAAMAPDGQRIAGAIGHTLWIWSLASGNVLAGPVDLESEARALQFGSAGGWLAASLADGRIQPLDPGTGRPVKAPLDAHLGTQFPGQQSLAATPDGTMLASEGAADGEVLLWDTSTWQQRERLAAYGFDRRSGPLFGGEDLVRSVAFSPDGKMLAAGTAHGPVLWFRGDQQWMRRGLSAQGVGLVEFARDGRSLLSAGGDGLLQWELDVEAWKRRACEIANRNLSRAEWQQYMAFGFDAAMAWMRFFDPPYRKSCIQH